MITSRLCAPGEYLTSIGRRLLIEPLYTDLMKTRPARLLPSARTPRRVPVIHPETVAAIDAIVNPRRLRDRNDQRVDESDAREISRKKTEAEQAAWSSKLASRSKPAWSKPARRSRLASSNEGAATMIPLKDDSPPP